MWAKTLWRCTVGVKVKRQCKEINRATFFDPGPNSMLVQTSRLSSNLSISKDWIKLNSGPDNEPYTLTTSQEKFLTKGNAEIGMKLSKLLLHLYLKRQQGLTLPENLQLQDIESMLPLSPIKLERFLIALVKRSTAYEREKREKVVQKIELEAVRNGRKAKQAVLEYPWLEYALFGNALLPRVPKGHMNTCHDSYAFKGLDFGQKIVIDCSYESYMTSYDIKMLANHIMYSYVSIRKNLRPFSMHLCNLNMDGQLMHQLLKINPGFAVNTAVGLHSCSYSDVFDRKQLVYISSDARQPLQYSPDHIYIFGGLIEKYLERRLCFKKAQKEGIKCVAFPFRQHVNWHSGGLPLSLNLHFDILLDVKNTGNWAQAITKHAPVRKLKQEDEQPNSMKRAWRKI